MNFMDLNAVWEYSTESLSDKKQTFLSISYLSGHQKYESLKK